MSVVSAGILLYRRRAAAVGAAEAGAEAGDTAGDTLSSPHGGAVGDAVGDTVEVWIAHMGGPFWARKDARGWSIPKGLVEQGEDSLGAALREFAEELGVEAPPVEYALLGDFRQKSGKIVRAYIAEAPAGFDVEVVQSNTFTTEWPRGSGVLREFPEIDAAAWVGIDGARQKLVAGQVALLDALLSVLAE